MHAWHGAWIRAWHACLNGPGSGQGGYATEYEFECDMASVHGWGTGGLGGD